MVLVGKDSAGIWVYECNQNYYKDLDDGRINGRDESYFGCGIHLQYHTYEVLAERYHFVVKYTNHTYDESPVYDNTTYHKVGCTCCAGYLRQKHDNVTTSFISNTQHSATFNCCGGGAVTTSHNIASTTLVNRSQHQITLSCCDGRTITTAHTGTVKYTAHSNTQHIVSSSCCSGTVLEAHNFVVNSSNSLVCSDCGKAKYPVIGVQNYPVVNLIK